MMQSGGKTQVRGRPTRTASIGALALIWLGGPVVAISSGAPPQESMEVKIERKPKYISNVGGQKPFDVTRHIVPLSEIQRSVPKNAIPGLVHPHFVAAGEVGELLAEKDRVLGVYFKGEAKAYPIKILNWHELVNDELAGLPILVSW